MPNLQRTWTIEEIRKIGNELITTTKNVTKKAYDAQQYFEQYNAFTQGPEYAMHQLKVEACKAVDGIDLNCSKEKELARTLYDAAIFVKGKMMELNGKMSNSLSGIVFDSTLEIAKKVIKELGPDPIIKPMADEGEGEDKNIGVGEASKVNVSTTPFGNYKDEVKSFRKVETSKTIVSTAPGGDEVTIVTKAEASSSSADEEDKVEIEKIKREVADDLDKLNISDESK